MGNNPSYARSQQRHIYKMEHVVLSYIWVPFLSLLSHTVDTNTVELASDSEPSE